MNCDPVYATSLTSGGFMKKSMACLSALLLLTSGALAANDAKEVERVKESGEVLKEILNIPDDIPQDLLDKAECVVVLPSAAASWFAAAVNITPGLGERPHFTRLRA
jgi:hypothetical protein